MVEWVAASLVVVVEWENPASVAQKGGSVGVDDGVAAAAVVAVLVGEVVAWVGGAAVGAVDGET